MKRNFVIAASFVVGMVFFGIGRAAARGTLISDANTVGGGGGSGLTIGESITGGVDARMLFDSDATLMESSAFTIRDTASLRQMFVNADPNPSISQAQFRVTNDNTSSSTVTSDFVAINYRSDYLVARIYGQTSGTDEFGQALAHQARFQCSTASDCVVVAQGGSLRLGNANRAGTSGTVGITINGSGVQLPTYNIEQIGGTATHFNKGACTLNGGSPSQCAVSVTGSSLGGALECVCSLKGTTHKGACQTSVSGGTLTLTTDNGITADAAYICW